MLHTVGYLLKLNNDWWNWLAVTKQKRRSIIQQVERAVPAPRVEIVQVIPKN